MIKVTFFLLSLLLFMSCTEVIDVDVPNGGARLVVEASINWEKGTSGNNQVVKLSTSTAYFSKEQNVPAIGAEVSVIKDNDGTKFTFTDQNNGSYITTNFIPEIGTSYTLQINYKGQNYEAKETLVGFTKISTVLQEDAFQDDEYRVRVLFDDMPNEDNFYMGEFTQANLKVPTLRPISDSFIDGNQAFVLYFDEKNISGAKIDIKVLGISEPYYYYIQQLVSQAADSGGPFQSIPAMVTGNCKNINNSDEQVLGYFRLSQFEKTSYTIQ